MLSPKIQRNHMLPITCIHEPCRNMEVNAGSKTPTSPNPLPDRYPVMLAGTIPNWKSKVLKLSGVSDASKRKITEFRAIRK